MPSFLQKPATLIGFGILLFLALNVIAERLLRPVLIDLTDAGLYTLSKGTREVVLGLEEPVTLEFYFSRQLAAPYPGLLSYGKRVEDMLTSIARIAPDRITVRVIEPEPFSETEDRAVEAGLSGVPLGDGSTLYLGLAAQNSLDGEATIPFFSEERESFLEYDLTKLIQSLGQTVRPRLTLLTSLPMAFGPGGPQAAFQGQSAPYVIYEQLGEFYNVQEITGDFDAIPADTEILMLAHPPALSDDQLYLIDQYVLAGKPLLAFLDPHAETLNPQAFAPSTSDLGPLLARWGVEMTRDQVVGDLVQAQRVSFGGYGPGSVKEYVFWLGLRLPFLSADDVTTGTLTSVNMGSAGVLRANNAGPSVTPLLSTSPSSMLYPAERAAGMPDPDALLRDLEPDGVSHVLAARLTGRAETAFPDRVAAASAPEMALSEGEIRVVVVSDADMLEDRFWVQTQDMFGQRLAVPIAGNGSLVLNLADHIAGSQALLGLRGRGISRRPFTVVDDLRKAAEARYLAEEQRLTSELEATEARLAELEGQGGDALALSPEQDAEVERFRTRVLDTRRALREVQRGLRSDIDALGSRLAALNILAVPLLVIVVGAVRHMRRRRRLKASMEGNS